MLQTTDISDYVFDRNKWRGLKVRHDLSDTIQYNAIQIVFLLSTSHGSFSGVNDDDDEDNCNY